MTPRRRIRSITALACVFIAADITRLIVQPADPVVALWLSDLIPIPLALGATVAAWSAARRAGGRTRRAWNLLGLGTLSWGLGEGVWSWYELVLGREVPFPSWADVGFLALIPFAAAALLSFPSAPALTRSKVRGVLDGAVAAGSLLVVSWATVLGPTLHAGGSSLTEQVLAVAYPAGDVILLTVVAIVAGRARGARGPFAFIAGGIVAIALADSAFLYLTQTGLYESGAVTDAGWNIGFVLIALGALRADAAAPANVTERVAGGIWFPYLCLAIAVATACIVQIVEGALPAPMFWISVITVATLAVRTALMHLDNVALNRDLETKVASRTAALSSALRQVEEAGRLQDQFVASISHELRTPLTTLLGSTQILLRPDLALDPALARIIEGTRRASERMARLIEDLLITSSISEGFHVADERFDLVASTRLRVERSACAPRATFNTPLELFVRGDLNRLGVVLDHLLANAAKFAPDAPVHVRIERQDDTVQVVVADLGPGIPIELHERIFERFYQVDGSDTRSNDGAGLGLFIARRLAEAMGGTLRADDVAIGASFRLTLPTAATATRPGIRRIA